MNYSQRWPLLAAQRQAYKSVYTLPSPFQLQEAIALGAHELRGQGLFAARLDMALCGLMKELGEEFFRDEIFVDRFSAAMEILLAARVFLEQNDSGQKGLLVRQLSIEAEDALTQWDHFLAREGRRNILFAAEEPAELS